MRSPVVLCLLLAIVYEAQCSYVAIAPKVFHPGWKYAVQLTVVNGPNNGVRMSVTGNIFNGKKQSLGAGIVTFENGQSAMLEIQVVASIQKDPNNVYSLQLDGSGAMAFSNSTPLQMAPLSRLAFIQTDRTVYSTGQLIQFRVVIVDEDLRPLYIPKNITIVNPTESTLARFYCNGSQAVYENTYQLAEFPELGNWFIAVQSSEGNIDERVKIRVVENVTSNFDVSAEVTPDLLIKESGDNRYVTVKVTAREMNGQGVKGDIKVTVLGYNRYFRDRISDASGQKSMEVDLSRELAASKDKLTLLVEVKDSAGRQCSAKVSLCVKERPVSVHFDPLRTDHVYRTGMPFLAQLRIEDARGQALDQDDLANEVVMTLADQSNSSNTVTHRVTLSQGQKDIVWNLTRINSTTSQLQLTASFMVKGRKYEASETIKKYRVLGNGTLNVRWIGLAPNLTMGGMASFVVDVCNATNFTAVTYMILSRGNIQSFGRAAPGQRVNVKVTPHMCPKGMLVVYGLTEVASTADTPELIADSLYLTTEHCQGKRVNPKLKSNNLEAGSNVALGLDVEWTDPEKQQIAAVDHHDVFVIAVDKRSITIHGQYDVNPVRVEEGLDRFVVNTTQRESEGQGRRKRSLHTGHTLTHPPATSTGDLLESLGLKLLGDVNLLAADTNSQQVASEENSDDDSQLAMSDRTFFPDTWLWKTSRTDDRGKLTLVETLPSCVTSWVVTAFAVRRDTELAITSEPLELDVFNKFYVRLNLPCTVRRGEKVEVRATVFNYDLINMDTTVTLAPSDNYIISGGSSETLMVKRNQAGSVTFMIVADKVGQFNIQVTATARRSNGATVTDTAERQITVKSAGVVRKKIFTFPVILSETRQPFDKNVSLDFSPWSKKDVIGSSTTVQVMVTGDLMGNVLNHLERLVMIPTGCGEQNLLSMVPSIHALTYLTATDLLHLDFVNRAKDYVRQGYTRQVQQYRWKNGGYSAFGTKDQTASTWLTAFVLKTFAQARTHVLDCVDIDIVNSAVDFLYTRQNAGTGEFTERGRVLQEEMLERSGGTEALSVFVTISLLEAKKRGIKIKDDNMNQAISYVKRVSSGQSVRENSFLAAMTAYALALHDHKSYTTQDSVVRLIGYAETKGAPWKRKGVTTDNPQQAKYIDKPSPLDVQITSYFLLTLNAVSKVTKAKELLMWLIRNQNCKGGYRSTQDTMMAVQAIAEHAVNFERALSYNDVVVTALSPSAKPRSVHIDSTNAAILQTVELPSQTSKLNIYVTGDANTLAVVKVLLTFHTNPDTAEKAFNNNQLSVVTKTNMERPGLHHIQACIKPGSGLEYRSMVVLCVTLPSGFVPKDLRETRTENPVAVRVEGKRDQVRFYMYQPQRECINLKIEEKVKIDELKPGCAALFAYYMPDMRSEADIHIGCPDGSCSCTSKDCESSRASTGTQLNLMLVIAGFGAIFSLVFAR